MAGSLILALLCALPAAADALRIAVYDAPLSRPGPGLLLRDLARAPLPADIDSTLATITALNADVLLLTGIDADHGGESLAALASHLAARGVVYPYRLVPPSNRGLASGQDLDGDGRLGGPGDAQGWGAFRGAGGMALLSRLPILSDGLRDFSALLWRDLPGAILPRLPGGAPFPSEKAQAMQRLSSGGHWEVPLALAPGQVLHLLASHASPPVFDGPEDANGLRNRDELRFWQLFLDGWAPDGGPGARAPFVLAGRFNLDPERGEGWREALSALLSNRQLTDPRPGDGSGDGAAAHDTWRRAGGGGLRLDYLLPSADLRVLDSGVLAHGPATAAQSRPVWLDLALPGPPG